MPKLRRIPEFEGLRGYLAWWVFAFHIITIAGFSAEDYPRGIRLLVRGEYPVDVFIILSGFVIFMLLETKQQKYWTFITQRFFRLYPVFIVVFILAVFAHPLRIESLNALPWDHNELDGLRASRWLQTDNFFWSNIVTHLTLLHSAIPETWLPTASTAFVSPGWSISLEWQFYLVAPMLLFIFKRFKFSSWIGFIIIAYISNYLLESHLTPMFPLGGFLLQKLLLFWIGICSFFLWHHTIEVEKQSQYTGSLLFAGIAPLVFPYTLSIPLTIWTIVLATAMAAQGKQKPFILIQWVRLLLCNRVALYMGAISYCTYLCHELCIWLIHWGFMQADFITSRQQLGLLLLGAGTPIVFLLASLLHHLIEIPGIKIGRHLTHNR